MAPLTDAEVTALSAELKPLTDTPERQTEFGLKMYNALFNAKPEFIAIFAKTHGLKEDEVLKSETLREFARFMTMALLDYVKLGNNETELKKTIKENWDKQPNPNMNKEHFLTIEQIVTAELKSTLKQGNNGDSMEKLIRYIFQFMITFM